MANQVFPLTNDLILPYNNGAYITYPAGIFAMSYTLGAVDSRAKVLNLNLILVVTEEGREIQVLQSFYIKEDGYNSGPALNQKDIDKAFEQKTSLSTQLAAAASNEQAARTELTRLKEESPDAKEEIETQVAIIQTAIQAQNEAREALDKLIVPDPEYAKAFKYDDVVKFFTEFALNDFGVQAAAMIPFNGKTVGYYIL